METVFGGSVEADGGSGNLKSFNYLMVIKKELTVDYYRERTAALPSLIRRCITYRAESPFSKAVHTPHQKTFHCVN